MIRFGDLKPGDLFRVVDEGVDRECIITDVDRDAEMVCVDTGVQEFWFHYSQLQPIPLNEAELLRLGFERQETDHGIKYMKGPFRVLTPEKGNFANLEVWYREDRRHFQSPLYVHELQNHHLSMTKVPLEKPVTH